MMDPDDISKAAEVLAAGGIVIIPTDTVYGVAADATNRKAVSRIYAAKGRTFDKPLIVFVAKFIAAQGFAEITPLSERLAGRYLPGPLSLVLKKKPGVLAENVSGDFETIGVRIPDHPVALSLLRASGFPLAVTSANRSGDKSPVRVEEINIEADFILNAGKAPGGVESTVVDATGTSPIILREGALETAEIEAFLNS